MYRFNTGSLMFDNRIDWSLRQINNQTTGNGHKSCMNDHCVGVWVGEWATVGIHVWVGSCAPAVEHCQYMAHYVFQTELRLKCRYIFHCYIWSTKFML